MSKKQLSNRLEILFAGLETEDGSTPEATLQVDNLVGTINGWTWDCDQDGLLVSCGHEASLALQIPQAEILGQSLENFALAPESAGRLNEVFRNADFPAEIDLDYLPRGRGRLPVRMLIFSYSAENHTTPGYHGFVQILPVVDEDSPPSPRSSINQSPPVIPSLGFLPEITPVLDFEPYTADHGCPEVARIDSPGMPGSCWTEAGLQSLVKHHPVLQPADGSLPAAVGLPFTLNQSTTGVIELMDETPNRAWTEEERLLIQDVANQLNLALENAQLYTAVQQELSERVRAEGEILLRERYQKKVAQAVAVLSQEGTRALPDFLRLLGEASQADRVIYFETRPDALGDPSWIMSGEWTADGIQSTGPAFPVSVNHWPAQSLALLETGLFLATQDQLDGLDENATLGSGIVTFLAISVPGKNPTPGFLRFESLKHNRAWAAEEIQALQLAASDLSNTLVREDLLGQLELSLEETEGLYNASRRLALAGDLQAMLAAILEGIPIVNLNRAELVSFGWNPNGQVEKIQLIANWYAGQGAVPAPVGTQVTGSLAALILATNQPRFITDVLGDAGLSLSITPMLLDEKTSALAILPLWVGRRQIGALLLKSEQPGIFHERHIRSYPPLVGQMAIAIENLHLLNEAQVSAEEARQRSEELALLNRVVSAVASSLDLRAGLQVVAEELGRSLSLSNASIALVNEDENALTILAEFAPEGHTTTGLSLPIQDNPAMCQVLSDRKPLIIPDSQHDPRTTSTHNLLETRGTHTLVILPLVSGKNVIGIVNLEISQPERVFTAEELRLAETIVFQAAAAIQNAHLFEQTQTALAETELLYRISRSIGQAASANELLDLVYENGLPEHADRVTFIYLQRTSSGEVIEAEVIGSRDLKAGTRQEGGRISTQIFPLFEHLGSDPIFIRDTTLEEQFPGTNTIFSQMKIRTACLVPFHSSGQVTGVMLVSASQPVQFSQKEIRLLQITADGIAIALEKQRLLQEAQRRALELQTAAEIARDTSGTLDLDTMLNRIVNMLCERFGFYHASIFLLDETGQYAVIREATGEAGAEMKIRGHRLAVGSRSIIGAVTATAQHMVVNDVSISDSHRPNPLLPLTRAELGIPLRLNEQVIGALDVQSTQANAFRVDDITVLEILADQIAVAIENTRAYELAQKAVVEMREVDRVKSQFLANMSHELRTPLNSIIGFSRVILKGIDGPISDIQQQDLTAIYNSGQHLLRLINDILDLSKIEAGKMELAFDDMNIPDVVSSVMPTAGGLVKDKPIKLTKHVPEDLPTVRADAMRVRQVLINLLSNAAKFTDEGSVTVTAGLQSGPDGGQEVIFRVIDTGPGIALEDQKKLFQPFSQVDDSPTRKTGGTGLGLSICKSLIDMHNGRIGLEASEIGKGSIFYFTLPLPVEEQTEPEPTPHGPVVMCIDDDMQVISLYERYLTPQGYRVVAVTDPLQAVSQARTIKPFAITLDVMMPNRDGWQVIQDLKNDPETRAVPVIMCTILEDEQKGFNLGATDYLVKPILQEEMVNALDRLNGAGKIHNVLVIDDDPVDLRLMKKILEQNPNLKVKLASGGNQGWSSLTSEPPDAVILDLFMPDMNGFTLLEQLRGSNELQDIPVIVLSGADLTADQHAQLAAFGQDMLAKGLLKEDELLSTLDRALRHYRTKG